LARFSYPCPSEAGLNDYTDHVSKLHFRQEDVQNLNQTQSVPKQFKSNELGDAGGFEFSGKLNVL